MGAPGRRATEGGRQSSRIHPGRDDEDGRPCTPTHTDNHHIAADTPTTHDTMQVDSHTVDPAQYVEQHRSQATGDLKSFWEKLAKAYEKK